MFLSERLLKPLIPSLYIRRFSVTKEVAHSIGKEPMLFLPIKIGTTEGSVCKP